MASKAVLLLCTFFLTHLTFSESQDSVNHDILIIVLSQQNRYHADNAMRFRTNVYDQATQLNTKKPTVLLSHEKWPMEEAWTIFPLMPRIYELTSNVAAVLFCGDETHIELERLLKELQLLDFSQDLFMGRPLYDTEPTIIHHFAFHDAPSMFAYPDMSACFLMSSPLIERVSLWLKNTPSAMDFSIDASHEFAKFLWNNDASLKLEEAKFLCGLVKNPADSGCATWLADNFPRCELPDVENDELFIAVKTCKKFHTERLSVVKGTWAREAGHVTYFSDVEDQSVPTVVLGIPNTERGHCAKLLAILKYAYNKLDSYSFKWIMIVDDDTLVSVKRLRKLLSCYNSSDYVVLGERYGYGLMRNGYNYVTLGGGMVLSHVTLRSVMESGTCVCGAPDAPDDMTFGLCLKQLSISITHVPHFHQARPEDYSEAYLHNHLPVTFHRHWNTDPYRVFKDWLVDEPSDRDEL